MENTIQITHFVSPYQFWYKRSQLHVIRRMEIVFQEEVHKFCIEQYDAEETGPDGYYEPVTGEIVAVYDPARKKWTRNRVLNSTNVVEGNIGRDTFQVWSLDEGVPKEAAAKYVKPLPSKYTHSENLHVKQGTLRNIVCLNHFYDPNDGRLNERASTVWGNSIITSLQDIILNAEKIYFKNATTHSIAGEQIEIGDLLFLTKQQKLIDAKDIILSARAQITDEKQFLEYMALKRTPAKAYKNYTNASVAACSNETLELAPVTIESLPTSAPESRADLSNAAANKPRTMSAQLECVSSKPVSEPTLTNSTGSECNALQKRIAHILKRSAPAKSTNVEAEAVASTLSATNSTANELTCANTGTL